MQPEKSLVIRLEKDGKVFVFMQDPKSRHWILYSTEELGQDEIISLLQNNEQTTL